jgi:hypothetical protein
MECLNCKKPMREKVVNDAYSVFYCLDCLSVSVSGNIWDCPHEKTHTVKRKWGTDQIRVQEECDQCGRLTGSAISAKGYDLSYLQWHDESINERNRRKYDDAQNVANDFRLWAKDEQSRRWFNDHSEYLNSEQWKKKRALVLNRDNYTCQSCLTSKATEVHHLTYKHWKNEPLFELVSVCRNCHETITKIDRGEL